MKEGKNLKKIHLLCNAHLDPVWLWQRSEGMAEAMATFRIAADFCEKYDNFVFNHNESVLYEWVLENDPVLFERIKMLVKVGKWRIMGGWYLQPDCVMPSGESIIRQIRVGNDFFKKHFGTVPKTSIGFDAFGHSKGLVQILKKCGYDNYAYLRPRDTECRPFVWKGFDGSEITAYKMYEWYNTPKGEALERIEGYIKDFPDREVNLVSWGIGNHGGGPSEKDLNDINDFISENKTHEIVHSDFDTYFSELDKSELETVDTSLTHCMVGCYTSMIRVKQGHRRLENELSMCEKMLAQSGVDYDKDKLLEAEKALLFTEFHDVLPGTAIKKVEEDSLRLIGYGEEILDRFISKSFFKLCQGQPKAKEGEIPVLAYNPHPYSVEGDFVAEFQMAEQNHPSNGIYQVKVRNEKGEYIPSQLEQEASAHGMDWRKRVVFHATLAPMGISRFDCELELKQESNRIKPYEETDTHFILNNKHLNIAINKETGLVEKYAFDSKEIIKTIKIKAYNDDADPWGMEVDGFNECIGEFTPAGFVKVIENGDVRTKIQAKFKYSKSEVIVTYIFAKYGKALDIDVKMLANDENTMFKLCIETTLEKNAKAYSQTMFGTEETRKEGKESVFQKWCGLRDNDNSINIINSGNYGGSFEDNEIRISLLRTAVYSAHPVDGVELAGEERIYEHIDMGERDFSFRICANEEYTDNEAEIFNQKPYVLSFFPSGMGEKTENCIELDNRHIIVSSIKDTDNGRIIRMFNSTDKKQVCNIYESINFEPFEVKTFRFENEKLIECNMLGGDCFLR